MEENKETENATPADLSVNPSAKRKKRLIVWGSIGLAVILILLFLPGIIVSHVVPPIASQLLKVKVEIGSAYINIFDGAVRIRNVKVHNPEGYNAPYAFELGHFYVDVAMLTLTKPKIEIKDIVIEDMHATLEMKWGRNNLEDISKNLKKPAESDQKTAEEEKPEKSGKEPPQMVIRHFKIAKSDFTMLKVPWPIPSVELTDIGDGKPITEFAAVVYDAIVEAVLTASKNISKEAGNVGKGLGKAADNLSKSTRKAGDAVNKAAKNVSKSLNKILRK